jgi:hypothetical protein
MESIELDGTTLKFSPLTLGDEDKWRDWLRQQLKAEAKRDAEEWGLAGEDKTNYLAKMSIQTAGGKCALLSPLGLEHAQTLEGTMEILRLSNLHHSPEPGIDEATLRRLMLEKREEVQMVLNSILPKSPEKKVKDGQKDGPP